MKKRTSLKILLIFSIAVMLVWAAFRSYKSHKQEQAAQHAHRIQSGLRFLAEKNATIYANHNGLYELDVNLGTWTLKVDGTKGHHRQDIAIGNEEIYFKKNTYASYTVYVFDQQYLSKVLVKADYPISIFAVSHDGRKLAYDTYLDDMRAQSAVMIFDIETGQKKQVYPQSVGSISWAIDDNSLFFGTINGIIRLSLKDNTQEKVAEGIWVTALPENSIGYIDRRNDRLACFKKDLSKNIETELFEIDFSPKGISWDPTGRFVVTGYLVGIGLFGHGVVPVIWDTQAEERYELPTFPIYTECIFWVDAPDDEIGNHLKKAVSDME